MAFLDTLLAYVTLLWPVLAVGIIVFALWGAAKTAAHESGRHLGIAGIGVVFVTVGAFSWKFGFVSMAALIGFIGLVLIVAGFSGGSR